MKKIMKLFTAAIVLASIMTLCIFAQDVVKPVNVTLHGDVVDCESYGQPATIVEGRTLVPLRAIFEALGASVEWDQSTKTVTSVMDDVNVKLTIGEKTLYKNGEEILLDVPAMIMNNRTLVPARAIAESFGVKVEWDASSRTVILTKPYERGVREGDVYVSEWMDIAFEADDALTFLTEEEIDEVMDLASGIYLDPETGKQFVDYTKLVTVYEFIVGDEMGNSISVITEKLDGDYTAQQYLEAAMTAYELIGVEASEPEYYEAVIAGKTFYCADVSAKRNGMDFYQCFAVKIADGRAFTITCTFIDEEYLSYMNGFVDISELDGDANRTTDETSDETSDDISSGRTETSDVKLSDEDYAAAEAVLAKYMDADITFNLNELAKYCVDSYGVEELNISNIDELFERAGFTPETFFEVLVSEMDIDEEYGEFAKALLDVVFEFKSDYADKVYYEIDLEPVTIDENTVVYFVDTYTPDLSFFEDNFEQLLEQALLQAAEQGVITQDMSESEMIDIATDIAVDELEKALKAGLENPEYTMSDYRMITVVRTDSGEWLVEMPEEDAEMVEMLKRGFLEEILGLEEPEVEFGDGTSSLEGEHVYGKLYYGMTVEECLEVIEGEAEYDEVTETMDVFDPNGIYADEDVNITGEVNCDYMCLWFYEGKLYSVTVTTPYAETPDEALETMFYVILYYGDGYEYDEESLSYTWINGNEEVVCSIEMEPETMEYYCSLDITDWS